MAGWISALRRGFSLWLLLGAFFCTGAGLVAINAVLMFEFGRAHLNELCAAARNAFEHGGAESLRLVLQGASTGPGVRVHLLDSSGQDLSTSQPRTGLTGTSKMLQGFAASEPHRFVLKMAEYSCVVDPPSHPPSIPLGPMSWVLPFVSVLCCTVGMYVTWRMRKIEVVIRHFGSGELAARMAVSSGDAIGRLARAFNQMADRIESLVASHQRLCADMAHELRSPLARLLLALRDVRRGSNGALDMVEREVNRINDLAVQLLDVARAEVDPSGLELEVIDVESLLAEIADHCQIEALERGCEIELFCSQAGAIYGDAELLRRAIENVLRNAIRHAPEGTGIELCGVGDGEVARITVRDRGCGVPEQALKNIFKPFCRIDTVREPCPAGVGLGLSIAQRAIALHEGRIYAESCAPGLRIVMRIPRNWQGGGSARKLRPQRRD